MNFMEIRAATKDDSEAIKEFLRKNDPDDYILDRIDRWLENNTVFIVVKKRVIGLSRLKYTPDGKAWLGGMRIDKNDRRQGIGTLLTEHTMEAAEAKKAQLFTSEKNIAACNQVKKMGFETKGRYTLMYYEIGDEKPCKLKKEKIWGKVKNSKILKENNFLLARGFTFYKISPELIGEGYTAEDGYAAVEKMEKDGRCFEITYFKGEKIIDGLKYLSLKSNYKKLWALIPRDVGLISILLKKGFRYEKWAKWAIVFEKKL